MNEHLMTKKMLSTLREGQDKLTNAKVKLPESEKEKKESDNFLRSTIQLIENIESGGKKKINEDMMGSEVDTSNTLEKGKPFPITKTTPQFSDIRVSQEESLIKTIGESVELDDKSLIYYPDNKDLVLNGKINSLNLKFQFRYNDPSGDGCYIWVDALQLTDTNSRTLGKIRDAFMNWKTVLLQNADLMEKLNKASTRN